MGEVSLHALQTMARWEMTAGSTDGLARGPWADFHRLQKSIGTHDVSCR